MSNSTSGEGPDQPSPVSGCVTLAPVIGRAEISILSGAPLPLRTAPGLDRPGAYIILRSHQGSRMEVYVGKSGALRDRLLGQSLLRPNQGATTVITVTASENDLSRDDAGALERLFTTAMMRCANVDVLNEAQPCHFSSGERYGPLRVFAGDVLCRIASAGLIPFHSPQIDLLAGPELCLPEVLDPVQPDALIGFKYRQLVRGAQRADAWFLRDGRAVLKAGSLVLSHRVSSLHGGQTSIFEEAKFSGLLRSSQNPGLLQVTADLTFETANFMSQFTGLGSGQLDRWKKIAPTSLAVETPISEVGGELLSLWRRGVDPCSCASVADELGELLKKIAPIGSSGWLMALKGDGSSAVGIAVQITNRALAGCVSRDVDVAMSLVFFHALRGSPGAAEVLGVLKGRLIARNVDLDPAPAEGPLL